MTRQWWPPMQDDVREIVEAFHKGGRPGAQQQFAELIRLRSLGPGDIEALARETLSAIRALEEKAS